jgi:hypothetical protein
LFVFFSPDFAFIHSGAMKAGEHVLPQIYFIQQWQAFGGISTRDCNNRSEDGAERLRGLDWVRGIGDYL